jgi:hypothetical protein
MRDPVSEIKHKRIEKGKLYTEITMLHSLSASYRLVEEDRSPFGLLIRVTLGLDLVPDVEEPVTFELHLEGMFPFQAPRLNCLTSFTKPSLADGRDLLSDVVQCPWTPSLKIYEIVLKLPEFVVNPSQNTAAALGRRLNPFEFGQFCLGQPISLDTWELQPNMRLFSCREIETASKEACFIAVTQTVILQLEPSAQHPDFGSMTSWASLYSLDHIQRCNTHPDHLTLMWKQMGEQPPYSQVLEMPEAEACVALILSNLHSLEEFMAQQQLSATIKAEEVTLQSIDKVSIDEILEAIACCEAELDNRLTLQAVKSLMELYQRAIEHLSAHCDSRFEVFLHKLHGMLGNDEVIALLRGETTTGELSLVDAPTGTQQRQDQQGMEASAVDTDHSDSAVEEVDRLLSSEDSCQKGLEKSQGGLKEPRGVLRACLWPDRPL